MDVHVPQAITDQLRRRGVDVLTAIEDDSAQLGDEALLEHASSLGRVLFTQDIRFKALALILAASGTTFCRVDIWTSVRRYYWTVCQGFRTYCSCFRTRGMAQCG
jgi:hypothetical protein